MSIPGWKTAFSAGESKIYTIKKNKLLFTLPILKKQWKVSFELKAKDFKDLGQVLHMTTGHVQQKTPAVWIDPARGFRISSLVGGRLVSKYTKELPSLRNTDGVGDGWKIWGWLKAYLPKHWIKIEIGQELEGSEILFSIAIGGVRVFFAVNSKPLELTNVKVFASSGWYKPQNGFIKNLLIENKDDAGKESSPDSKWVKSLKTTTMMIAMMLMNRNRNMNRNTNRIGNG